MSPNNDKCDTVVNKTVSPPCGHQREKFSRMTPRCFLLAVTLLASCLVFCSSYAKHFERFEQSKSTGALNNYSDRDVVISKHKAITFIKSIQQRPCPVKYFKELSINRDFISNIKEGVASSSQMNYRYQTHLAEDELYSNNSMIPNINLNIPKAFNTDFANPCWYEPLVGDNRELKCLPYFFLIGFAKSGTTDLFFKMGIHPQIVAKKKEHQWWTMRRFPNKKDGSTAMPLDGYLKRFQKASNCLQSIAKLHLPGPVRLVIGDGSPTTVWHNKHWKSLPGNAGAQEPRVINADYIRHYLPASKIIAIVRDPVDRLFSDYEYFWHENGKPSPEDFHTKVSRAISMMRECLGKYSTRTCAYSQESGKARIRLGMYSVYLQDWFRIFPKSQIHVLRTEDYHVSMETELKKIFSFLELDLLDDSVYGELRSIPKANVQTSKQTRIAMFPETEKLLRDFYAPYNAELAKLLNNTDYVWKQKT